MPNLFFKGLKVKPAVNFLDESGRVYDFWEEVSNGAWEAYGRSLGRKLKRRAAGNFRGGDRQRKVIGFWVEKA